MKSNFKSNLIVALVLVLVISGMIFSMGFIKTKSATNTNTSKNNTLNNSHVQNSKLQNKETPVVGSFENLKKLLKWDEYKKRRIMFDEAYGNTMIVEKSVANVNVMNTADTAQSTASKDKTDYSKTNLQVQGVDEGDVVKTDGKYIYEITNGKITILDIRNNKKIIELKGIKFDNDFNPSELYVDSKKMIVIGIAQNNRVSYKNKLRHDFYTPMTKAFVYDISDINNLKLERELDVEGDYVSSRKIGDNLYMVTNKSIGYFSDENNQEYLTPTYRDTLKSKEYKTNGFDKIRYFPNCIDWNYVNVAGVNLSKNDAMQVSTYVGHGENIYVSENNMYIAALDNQLQYSYGWCQLNENSNTIVYKFKLKDGATEFVAKGKAKGNILNQFSMDENNGYFRIATTSGNLFTKDINETSKNNLYVLDANMKSVGKLEDLAPTEKIYSVRFMGDKAYIVTFKKVDPLFVIDLKNPEKPTVLGKLKIPGYSDYLQPFDENHIIGFGKDTIDPAKEDTDPNDIDRAYYQGMKIAMFDVTDVNNPKEMFKTIIGDRGTDSELLYNHKALLFSKEKGLLAFPVTVMEVKDKKENSNKLEDITQYGEFTFQGAYIYNINLKDGFKLKGRISHLTKEDYDKSGDYYGDMNKYVNRILYVGDKLYTLSNSVVKENNISDLEEVCSYQIGDYKVK